LLLASTSPRRATILHEHGFTFDVVAPSFEEDSFDTRGLSPERVAETLSLRKAESVAAFTRDGVILAADTVVALGDRLFGKAIDRDDARRILESLSGSVHRVITGVTVMDAGNHDQLISSEVTSVRMRRWSSAELESYLDTLDWQGKAGAYGIQNQGDPFVECVEGSFTNVVGLPIELVAGMLEEYGIVPHM
jgi:septum formation protein